MPLDMAIGSGPQAQHDPFTAHNESKDAHCLFPVALRGAGWERRDGTYGKMPNHRVLIRTSPDFTDAWPLASVSRTYGLVTNKELFNAVEDRFREAFTQHQLQGVEITDRIAYDGRNSYRTYVFPEVKCDIGAKSPIAFRTIVQNSYGGSSLRILSGAIEFFCTNGIVRGEYDQAYRRHTSGVQIHQLADVVYRSIERFFADAEMYKQWTTQYVTREQTMEMFERIAKTPKLYEALIDQWAYEREQRGSTVWSAYSAMTYYASHNEGTFATRADATSISAVMMRRELGVAAWLRTPAWAKFVGADA